MALGQTDVTSVITDDPNSEGRVIDGRLRRRVLVTGAAGRIGSYFSENARELYDLRLMVRDCDSDDAVESIRPHGQVVTGDLVDLASMLRICEGIDTVVHLAAEPNPSAPWGILLRNNIIGTYNTFVAAKSAGCRRVVFASSIHAVSGSASDVQVKTSDPVNPGDLYGVSKAFGEALAAYMAGQEELSVIAIRIGAFQSLEDARKECSHRMLDAFVSKRDLFQLIRRCIETERVHHAIFHGLSNNRFKRLDISNARELVGYEPVDDLTSENPLLQKLELARVIAHNQSDPGQLSGIREEMESGGRVLGPRANG